MDTYIAERDEGGDEWDAVKLSRLVAEEKRVQAAFMSYVEQIRTEGTSFADASLRFEFGEWILSVGGQQVAWARIGASDWLVVSYSGARSEYAEIVADGLDEADAVAELIAIGGTLVSLRAAA